MKIPSRLRLALLALVCLLSGLACSDAGQPTLRLLSADSVCPISGSAGSDVGAAGGTSGDGGSGGVSAAGGSDLAGSSGASGSGGEAGLAGTGGEGGSAPTLSPVVVIGPTGQSVAGGVDKVGLLPGIPDASIPFWRNDFYYKDGTHSFGPLAVTPHGLSFGHEMALGQRLKAAGYHVAIVKLWKGGTFSKSWIPTCVTDGCAAFYFYPELSEALAALPAQFPGATSWRFLWNWDQGQEEARAGAVATANQWAPNYAVIRDAVLARIGAAFPGAPVTRFIVQTNPGIPPGPCGAVCVSIVTTAQAAAAPDPQHLILTGDLPYRSDNVHPTGPGENTIGNRIADVAISELGPP